MCWGCATLGGVCRRQEKVEVSGCVGITSSETLVNDAAAGRILGLVSFVQNEKPLTNPLVHENNCKLRLTAALVE